MAADQSDARRSRTIRLNIPSELGWERTAMDVAASVARRMGFPPDRIEDIRTAVSEATINAIEHGHPPNASQDLVITLIREGESLEIDVHDQSPTPFPPLEDAGTMPNLQDKLSGRSSTRGWGTFLIRSLVDEVEFCSTPGGNLVRMVIHLER
jgi:serine/threonine-protein kinase RsbW